MKQQIENIIKKGEVVDKIIYKIECDLNDRKNMHLNNLDEDIQEEIRAKWKVLITEVLSDSLIADEVLKVVVEKIEKMTFLDKNSIYHYSLVQEKIINLLTNSSTLEGEQSEHLSHNKENE